MTRVQAAAGHDLSCGACGGPRLPGDKYCGVCGAAQLQSATLPDPERQAQSYWDELLDELRDAALGDYEILGLLGRGGMAAVYLGHEIALDRKVAIKVMSPSLMVDSGMIERFGHEARIMATLNHPHIVTIYAIRTVDRLYFFVMQLIEGCPVSDLLGAEPLPIRVIQSIVRQVGEALEYAHGRGVVHRDIKPGNIMLDKRGRAIVTDFGIAKVAESPSHTMTGGTIGTPGYMSPEQCMASPLTGASDQYSLGIVAYELLTGSTPFTGSALALQIAHLQMPPPPIRDRRPDCPPDLEAAVLRMLAKEPEARWPTLTEAIAAIGGDHLGEQDPVSTTLRERIGKSIHAFSPTPISPSPPSRARRKPPATPSGSAIKRVTTVQLTGPTEPLALGESVELRAQPTDASGTKVPGMSMTWVSDRPDIIAVTPEGFATALRPGLAVITVMCEGELATMRLVVAPRAAKPSKRFVAALAIIGLGASVAIGIGLKAALSSPADPAPTTVDSLPTASPDPGLEPLPPPAPGLDPGPATVARIGVSPGQANLTPGGTITLRASILDAANAPVSGQPVTWSSGNTGVATVSRTGFVRAQAAGTAIITARSGGVAETAVIVVAATAGTDPSPTAPTMARVTLTPAAVQLQEGQPTTLVASLLSSSNQVMTGDVTWSVADPGVATVVPNGLRATVTGRQAGSTKVIASSNGNVGEATVTVSAPAPTVDPNRDRLRIDGAKAAIEAYGVAINTGDLARLRELYPSMTPARADVWRDSYFARDVRNLTATIRISDVQITGDVVTAVFDLTLRYSPPRSDPRQDQIRSTAVLGEAGGRWTIRSIAESRIP